MKRFRLLAAVLGRGPHQAIAVHPHQLAFRAGGIGERPEHVEHRADPELAARAGGMAQRHVVMGREQERDADQVDRSRRAFGRARDVHGCPAAAVPPKYQCHTRRLRFAHVGGIGETSLRRPPGRP